MKNFLYLVSALLCASAYSFGVPQDPSKDTSTTDTALVITNKEDSTVKSSVAENTSTVSTTNTSVSVGTTTLEKDHNINLNINASTQKACRASVYNFADVVEPLISAVVNVYTSQNAKQPEIQKPNKNPFGKNLPDNFRDFFDNFEQFFGDDGSIKPGKRALGSGFIIDASGYIVTNHHVVEGADEIHIKMYDGKEYQAKLIGNDVKTDLALLKIDADKALPFLKFGNSDTIRIGEPIVTIGNPFGLECTVTSGIISSKSRDINLGVDSVVDGYIQTDAPINSGNSGGPMINTCGEVIGINTAIWSHSGGNIGIGFAIPSNNAEYVIGQLKSSGKVSRVLLNIMIQELTRDLAEGMGIKDVFGVLVTQVTPGGIGDNAGLKSGDVILSANGVDVKMSSKLRSLVAQLKQNEEVKFVVLREGKKINLSAKIVSTSNMTHSSTFVEKHGVTFEEITEVNADKYGIKGSNLKGIIITKIDPKSKWRGIAVGDVIVSVNQQKVENIASFERIYNGLQKSDRKNIVLHIKRGDVIVFLAFPIN